MQIVIGTLLVVGLIILTIMICLLNAYKNEIKRKERKNEIFS